MAVLPRASASLTDRPKPTPNSLPADLLEGLAVRQAGACRGRITMTPQSQGHGATSKEGWAMTAPPSHLRLSSLVGHDPVRGTCVSHVVPGDLSLPVGLRTTKIFGWGGQRAPFRPPYAALVP